MHEIVSRLLRGLFNPAFRALPPVEPEVIPFKELKADRMAELAVPQAELLLKEHLKMLWGRRPQKK